jgi:hypothetical protein
VFALLSVIEKMASVKAVACHALRHQAADLLSELFHADIYNYYCPQKSAELNFENRAIFRHLLQ